MTGPFVLDASLGFAVFSNESSNHDLTQIGSLLVAGGVVVPQHWLSEMANALTMAVRRKRLSSADRAGIWADLLNMPIAIDRADLGLFDPLIALADRHRLTAYDAAYLELAQRTGHALATLDADLRAAAKREKIALLPA